LDDDVIIVTSSVHRTQFTRVLFSPPVIYHYSQVINSIRRKTINKLNKLTPSPQMLKTKSSLKQLSYLSANFWMPDAKNDAGCCLCHCRTTDCTSVYDTNFRRLSIFLH